ncbi:DUF4190 domain-containing protein [Agreia sp. COWG]|uniref:DUF4190 domain-containing protein n=1 Tax=Agreia sp. COWG TaxID=2773266 RepID=UPI0019270BA8|nr:DUF4190 domain-containing protein [Agreia sp. COWG]
MDAYQETQRTNVLSIVTLVTSVLGLAVVPIVLGHVSLSQIRKSGEQGRVMAVIGLVIGYLSLAGYLALIGTVIAVFVTRGMSGGSQ